MLKTNTQLTKSY